MKTTIRIIMYKLLTFIPFIIIVSYLPSYGQNIAALPVENDGMFKLNNGNSQIIIDGNSGSRVLSFKLDGEEILGTKNINPRMYGSTLWPSPEGKWKGQGILDASRYTVKFFNGTDLLLQSQNDTLRGFSFTKEFQISQTDTSFVIKYIITNISKDLQEVAPWEVTRVPTGGLVFFPKRFPQDLPKSNKIYPLLAIQDSVGIIWCPYDSSSISAKKLFMEGGEGWVAYVRNRIIFIKKFPIIELGQSAPGEKNLEIYVNKEKTYMELENQGVFQKLSTGGSLSYEVKWFARRLPSGIKVEIGNKALLNYIRSVVKNN